MCQDRRKKLGEQAVVAPLTVALPAPNKQEKPMSAGGQPFPRYCISLPYPWTIRVPQLAGMDEGFYPWCT
jgi:hypothetical protein